MSDLNAWERNQHKKEAQKKATDFLIEKIEELFNLNKSEQIKLLNKYGIEEIPNYEKDRVILLIKIIKEV